MKPTPVSNRHRATALVVVLSCIVLMSILLISYLVAMQLDRLSTQNYAQGIKAQELAQGALQEIVGDLRREIDAGSRSGAIYTTNNIRIYIPSTNITSQPARAGFTTAQFASLPSTLVRVSRANDTFYTTPPAGYSPSLMPSNRASAVPSTASSGNRRLISADRWNKPLLMGTNVPAVFSNNPPDWIYVTRGGSRQMTSADVTNASASSDLTQTNSVLGRYSYVIYEQGGLLDVNVAGFPSSAFSETNGTNAVGGKAYTAYADLAQLPGLNSTTVDQIINWRSKGSLNATTNRFVTATATNAATGFRSFKSGDSPFLGRQDLINYFRQNASLTNNLNALESIGTFSRAINAPSWTPSTPAGSTVDYAANAESTTFFSPGEGPGGTSNIPNPNRNIANIRAPGNLSLSYYKDDGSTVSYSVSTGEPFLQRRFSLARIAWLTPNGPASGRTTAIKDCFGLTWTTDNHGVPCWKYEHGDSQRILALDQVAALGREPDFFELLKAAILNGSLGKHPGTTNLVKDNNIDEWSNPKGKTNGQIGVAGIEFDLTMSFPDLQILQIGANILDQYDSDGFPTQIYFDPSADASLARGPENIVFGQENLPYLTRIFPFYLESQPGGLDGWLQPEIWNISQMPTSATMPTTFPTKFRIALHGAAVVGWHQKDPGKGFPNDKRQDLSAVSTFNGSLPTGFIYFSDPGGASSPFYQSPQILTTGNAGNYSATAAKNIWQPSAFQTADGGNPFVAFHIGTAVFGTGTANVSDALDKAGANLSALINPSPILTVALEYSPDNGATYRPYSHISKISTYNPVEAFPDGTSGRTSAANFGMHFMQAVNVPTGSRFYSHADPRTDRFSINSSETGHGGQGPNGVYLGGKWEQNLSLVPAGFNGDGFKTSPRNNPPRPDEAAAGEAMASPANSFFYASGAVRSGWNALWQNTFTVGDWIQNLPYDSGDARAKWSWLWYGDPDGIVRPGDGYRVLYTQLNGDGTMQFTTPANSPANVQNARRPVILNRPFRSVGELGYAFRDLPYKSLDFFSAKSADAGLLDFFTVTDEPAVVAGQINPNFANRDVLKAVLSGAAKKEIDPSTKITAADAQATAQAIVNTIQASGSIVANRSSLVTALSDPMFSALTATADSGNKAYLEAPVRALSSVSNTRTWNLLIDVIAQTGRYTKSAQNLNDFTVEGEKRYWLHVALDRFTGKVIDQQLEPVYE